MAFYSENKWMIVYMYLIVSLWTNYCCTFVQYISPSSPYLANKAKGVIQSLNKKTQEVHVWDI